MNRTHLIIGAAVLGLGALWYVRRNAWRTRPAPSGDHPDAPFQTQASASSAGPIRQSSIVAQGSAGSKPRPYETVHLHAPTKRYGT